VRECRPGAERGPVVEISADGEGPDLRVKYEFVVAPSGSGRSSAWAPSLPRISLPPRRRNWLRQPTPRWCASDSIPGPNPRAPTACLSWGSVRTSWFRRSRGQPEDDCRAHGRRERDVTKWIDRVPAFLHDGTPARKREARCPRFCSARLTHRDDCPSVSSEPGPTIRCTTVSMPTRPPTP